MTHTYHIEGITCSGCEAKVKTELSNIDSVIQVAIFKEKKQITITMSKHVELVDLQQALGGKSSKYQISLPNTSLNKTSKTDCCSTNKKTTNTAKYTHQPGNYYCPMHCEGDKEYTKAGDCPVCGMDLVSTTPDDNEKSKTYDDLVHKMKIAVLFTVPIFIIAMSDMIPNNPLLTVLDYATWNWMQFALSLPVVFYACWMFFKRAWKSVVTWNLNMFTLIGIGSGVAFIFSVFGLFFPEIFPTEFKTHSGHVGLYFEATTVILTLVLLGQLLEARAHSQTSGAIKELMKLAPTEATLIQEGEDQIISIHNIKKGDLLRVKPGDKIPVDGKIIEGNTTIDESMISGEPIPVDKNKAMMLMQEPLTAPNPLRWKLKK